MMANLRFEFIKIPRLVLSTATVPEIFVGISYNHVENSTSTQKYYFSTSP
jgi:hypothetical protein